MAGRLCSQKRPTPGRSAVKPKRFSSSAQLARLGAGERFHLWIRAAGRKLSAQGTEGTLHGCARPPTPGDKARVLGPSGSLLPRARGAVRSHGCTQTPMPGPVPWVLPEPRTRPADRGCCLRALLQPPRAAASPGRRKAHPHGAGASRPTREVTAGDIRAAATRRTALVPVHPVPTGSLPAAPTRPGHQNEPLHAGPLRPPLLVPENHRSPPESIFLEGCVAPTLRSYY